MADDDMEATVLVFRNNHGDPIVVPEDIAEENDRTYRAAQMHLQGASWRSIAMAEGYLDAAAAKSDVTRYRAEARALLTEHSRQELMEQEIARINQLQAAVWPQAMKGHLPAGKFVLDCIITRMKALKLDEPTPEEELTGPKTVVIPHDDDGFTDSLRRAMDS